METHLPPSASIFYISNLHLKVDFKLYEGQGHGNR